MNMCLQIYRGDNLINEIKSTDKGYIYEHVARIYRTKLENLAKHTYIMTGWCEIQKAEVHYINDNINFYYRYKFTGVTL